MSERDNPRETEGEGNYKTVRFSNINMSKVEIATNLESKTNQDKQRRFTPLKKEMILINPRLRGFEYKFIFPKNSERPKGEAQIIYAILDFYKEIGENKLFDL